MAIICDEQRAAIAILSNVFLSSETSNYINYVSDRKRKSEILLSELVKEAEYSENIAKVMGYVTNIVPKYQDKTFKAHFRLDRSTVEVLMGLLPKEVSRTGRPSLRKISTETTVLLSLWTLANQESLREVADRFGLGIGHAHREFEYFCQEVARLRHALIVWPTRTTAEKVMRQFDNLREISFPDVIGCVDGTFVPISDPKKEREAYVTRKKFAAVILQGVCDAKLRFTDVFTGWPGSTHDSRVWSNCRLLSRITEGKLLPEGAHLLGDCAYPLQTYLMVPFKDNGHLTRKEKNYNYRLSSSRIVIEQAFGQLFGRFRKLKYLHMFRLDRIPVVITSACVLHNLCIMEADDFDDLSEENASENEELGTDNDHLDIPASDEAKKKQGAIADYLYNRVIEEQLM